MDKKSVKCLKEKEIWTSAEKDHVMQSKAPEYVVLHGHTQLDTSENILSCNFRAEPLSSKTSRRFDTL